MRAGAKIWIACAWAVIALCLLSVGRVADAPREGQYSQIAVDESDAAGDVSTCVLSTPYDDDLQAKREANRWAMPSTAITLQGVAGRTSPTDVLHRLLRMYGLLPHAPQSTLTYTGDGAEQIVLSKRFHTGYYIYHRCQLRC